MPGGSAVTPGGTSGAGSSGGSCSGACGSFAPIRGPTTICSSVRVLGPKPGCDGVGFFSALPHSSPRPDLPSETARVRRCRGSGSIPPARRRNRRSDPRARPGRAAASHPCCRPAARDPGESRPRCQSERRAALAARQIGFGALRKFGALCVEQPQRAEPRVARVEQPKPVLALFDMCRGEHEPVHQHGVAEELRHARRKRQRESAGCPGPADRTRSGTRDRPAAPTASALVLKILS